MLRLPGLATRRVVSRRLYSSVSAAPVKWGFLGCGRIASDFVNALKSVPGAELVACAARSQAGADKFAQLHDVTTAYSSYADMLADDAVELVYVSTIHHLHKEHALMCLQAGKHVLVEKPIALNLADTQALVTEARKQGVFLMEGMWTRFFPAVRAARKMIADGDIGEVKSVSADFGFIMDAESRPHMVDPAQGGGGLMEIGCYPLAAAVMALGTTQLSVSAGGHVVGGCDMAAGVTLAGPNGEVAVLSYTLHAQTPEETLIIGTEGYIKIHSPAHCPTQLTVTKVGGREDKTEETLDFPLPLPAKTARLGPGDLSTSDCPAPYAMFHYPNSIGMQYEAAAVMECIRAGKLESEEFTLEESLTVMQICDEVRRQVGVVWPFEVDKNA